MEHIEKNHMFQGKEGKGVFLSSLSRSDVWDLVQETLTKPDATSVHRSRADRQVYKKNFAFPVGVHGRSGTCCNSVTVILESSSQQVVTAFPSV